MPIVKIPSAIEPPKSPHSTAWLEKISPRKGAATTTAGVSRQWIKQPKDAMEATLCIVFLCVCLGDCVDAGE